MTDHATPAAIESAPKSMTRADSISTRDACSITWRKSADDIPAELWEACFPAPLEGLWWYQTLDRSGLEGQFQFEYGLIEIGGRAVGIVPIFLMDVPMDLVAPPWIAKLLNLAARIAPGLRYQRTLFVGSPCADEGTVGLMPGTSLGEVAGPIQDALVRRAVEVGAAMTVWKDFPAADAGELNRLCKSNGLFAAVSYPGTRIDLSGGDFAGYLKSISSSHRHQLKKKLKRSREMGSLSSSVVQNPDPETLKEIFGLFWQTYEKGKTKFEILNLKFFELIATERVAHFVLLRDDATQKLVAFMLCFRLGSRVINKFIGLDYNYDGNWYLYFRLWEVAITWAISNGANDFQSGQTGYRAKLDVGHSLVPLTNYCRHRNPVLHKIFGLVARGIDWASLDGDLKVWVTAHPQSNK